MCDQINLVSTLNSDTKCLNLYHIHILYIHRYLLLIKAVTISSFSLINTECQNGDDVFVRTYDDFGIHIQS